MNGSVRCGVARCSVVGESGHLCRKEGGEASDHAHSRAYGAGVDAAGQSPACPALGQIPQPRLGDLLEGDRRRLRVDDAEIAQPPGDAGVFRFPAAAVGQFLGASAGAEKESAPARGPVAGRTTEGLPELFRLVEKRPDLGVGEGVDQALGPCGGLTFLVASSWRHCSAYCISSRSCTDSRCRSMCLAPPGPLSS